MSQIRLSDIKAARHGDEIDYLLDLVKRLGRMIENLNLMHHSNHYGCFENCDYPKCRSVRALLEELEQ